MNAVHCGASVSDLYRAFISSMVVTYIYCMFAMHICTMHNRIIYASAVWVERLALYFSPVHIFLAFARLFLQRIEFSFILVCAVAYFPFDSFKALLEVFRISMSTKTTLKSVYKSIRRVLGSCA